LQGTVGDQLQSRRLGPLHTHLDRRTEAAEDRTLALDLRPDARDLAQLAAQIVLDDGQRAVAVVLERDEHLPLVRGPSEAAADREIGEVGLRLLEEEVRDLASAIHRVLEPRARRRAEAHG